MLFIASYVVDLPIPPPRIIREAKISKDKMSTPKITNLEPRLGALFAAALTAISAFVWYSCDSSGLSREGHAWLVTFYCMESTGGERSAKRLSSTYAKGTTSGAYCDRSLEDTTLVIEQNKHTSLPNR